MSHNNIARRPNTQGQVPQSLGVFLLRVPFVFAFFLGGGPKKRHTQDSTVQKGYRKNKNAMYGSPAAPKTGSKKPQPRVSSHMFCPCFVFQNVYLKQTSSVCDLSSTNVSQLLLPNQKNSSMCDSGLCAFVRCVRREIQQKQNKQNVWCRPFKCKIM